MSAGKLNINIDQGSNFYLKLTMSDDSEALLDLTGCSFAGKIRKNISDAAARVSFTCTILNQTTNKGQVEITLTASQTAAIQLERQTKAARVPEVFCYDIEFTDTLSTVKRIVEGLAYISPEVTR